jgi:CubicO group peptidase (beta-lactamase class C family)
MGLLGHLLARRTGESYDALIRRLICEPLGLANTVVAPSDEQAKRLVPGHTPDGTPAPRWHFDALAGAGALLSTADDLLAFLQANLAPADDALGHAIARAQQVEHTSWLGSNQGLGWQIDNNTMHRLVMYWHNGGTGGYVSFVGFDQLRATAVVVLSNSGDAFAGDDGVDQLGARILKVATKVSLG